MNCRGHGVKPIFITSRISSNGAGTRVLAEVEHGFAGARAGNAFAHASKPEAATYRASQPRRKLILLFSSAEFIRCFFALGRFLR
jgi:hypothetical protein